MHVLIWPPSNPNQPTYHSNLHHHRHQHHHRHRHQPRPQHHRPRHQPLGLLGAVWGPLGASGAFLGVCWRSRGSSRGEELDVSVRDPPLRRLVLGPSWRSLGPSWGVGSLGALLGGFGAFREGPSAVLELSRGASWAALERQEPENARTQESFKVFADIFGYGFLGPLLEGRLKRSYGTTWGRLGESRGHFGRLGKIFGRFGAFLEPLRPSWGPFGFEVSCDNACGAAAGHDSP